MAKQFNQEAGSGFLARLNLYLSLAHTFHDAKVAIKVQEKLTREVLSPARLQEIVTAFRNRNLYHKWILLHRAQLLVGIKLIALYGREEGGNRLESDKDRAKIGELTLAINSCYGPGPGEPNWPLEDIIVHVQRVRSSITPRLSLVASLPSASLGPSTTRAGPLQENKHQGTACRAPTKTGATNGGGRGGFGGRRCGPTLR